MKTGILALCVICVAACARTTAGGALPAGEWTGDMHAPELPVAIGLKAHVSDTQAIRLAVFEAMGFDGGSMTAVRLRGDTLSFTWPSEDARACRLLRADDGGYAGECTATGESTWQLRLLPPAQRRAPVGYAATILKRPDLQWTSGTYPWGRLHIPATGDTAAAPARAAEIAAALARGLSIAGASSYDRPVDVFLVAGRPEVKALSGMPVGSIADPLGSTVILAGHGTLGTVNRHELMHVLSINIWGVPREPAAWIREGIAIFAGQTCAGYGIHQLAAALTDEGRALSLRTLRDEFYGHNDIVTYLQSGSIFQHLYDTRGREFTCTAWEHGLESALAGEGATLEGYEAEWRAFLARPEHRPTTVDWTRMGPRGCG